MSLSPISSRKQHLVVSSREYAAITFSDGARIVKGPEAPPLRDARYDSGIRRILLNFPMSLLVFEAARGAVRKLETV